MADRINLIPQAGERALIVGQTGSGKTAFACWLLLRIEETPTIIYDTKIEPKFTALPNSTVVTTVEAAHVIVEETPEYDYIIVRPDESYLDNPKKLDSMLLYHYRNLHNTVAYIDELTEFHNGPRPYAGLISLLSRGRSKGITTVCSTQRPRNISRSIISEAQKVYVFFLADKDDRKRLEDIIPDFASLQRPPRHGFYFFESGTDTPHLFSPVTLDKALDKGYVDTTVPDTGPREADASKHVWV